MTTYEQQLDADLSWALREGSMHFEKASAVHRSLQKIARRLDELGIPYALAGGMALFLHGYRCFTEDVDLLVTKADLRRIHHELEGTDYVRSSHGTKNLRDTQTGVAIKFLVAGDFAGDGKPNPVAFPNPAGVNEEIDGIRCLTLPKLIELKLASGITNPRRGKDLIDVQETIALLQLPEEFASNLHPFVQDKFRELWRIIQENPELPA